MLPNPSKWKYLFVPSLFVEIKPTPQVFKLLIVNVPETNVYSQIKLEVKKVLVRKFFVCVLAGGLGFEPRFPESKSGVLPLDDPPTRHEFTPNGVSACVKGECSE